MGQRGKGCGPEPSRWFLGVEETGKEGCTGLGLAGLSNFILLWGTEFSCLIPGSGECCPPGFQASLITRNQSEARQETGARLQWSPCSSSRGSNKQSSLAHWPPEAGWAGSFYGVRLGVCPGVRQEGWLRRFAHPLVVVCAGGTCSARLLLSALWAYLAFLYLLSRICLNCTCTHLFFISYRFSLFL